MSKDKKCTCKACKNTVFHCQICKFEGFLLPRRRRGCLSSLLRKMYPSSTEKHSCAFICRYLRLLHHHRQEDRRLQFLYQRENNNQIASPVRADSHFWMEISFEFLLECLNIEYFPSQSWRKYRKENSNVFSGKNGYD